MNRAETTAMLSENLERFVLKKYPLWGAEVRLNDERDVFADSESKGRVDYMAIETLGMSHSIRSIEAGYVHAFEVKSCMEDFRSGHGLNRVGDVNWLVMTAHLSEQLIDQGVDTSGWNRLVWLGDKFTNSSTVYAHATSRKMPMSQALWLILTNSDRVRRNRGKGVLV
jgi:hypothetical protein